MSENFFPTPNSSGFEYFLFFHSLSRLYLDSIQDMTLFSMTNQGAIILVVEDERAVARGLIYGLRKEGFAVEWAETGKAALLLVNQVAPNLIVLAPI